MDASRPEITRKNSLMIALVIIEAVVTVFMLAFAAYLAVKILYYRSMTKISNTFSGGTTSDDCPAGKNGTSAGADYKVLGKAKMTVGGKEVELCCATSESKEAQAKVCSDKNNNYTVIYSKVNGQYILGSEMYPQGQKRCIKTFKESGESAEICL